MESTCVVKLGLRSFMNSISYKAIKLALALSEYGKLAFYEETCIPMGFQSTVVNNQIKLIYLIFELNC
jgi:hypothetical protein